MDWAKHQRRILARLGEDATLTPQGGGMPIAVRGVFARAYAESSIGQLGVADTVPTFGAIHADIPNVAAGDQLVVHGTTFIVRGVEPNLPAGLVVLRLQES